MEGSKVEFHYTTVQTECVLCVFPTDHNVVNNNVGITDSITD